MDGVAVAQALRAEILAGRQRAGVVPGLATILIGDHAPSMQFVRNKSVAAAELGFNFFLRMLPSTVSEQTLMATISEFNDDSEAHGIIIQLPLPAHIRPSRILQAISRKKDVDGFHVANMGSLALGHYKDASVLNNIPCAAKACVTLLDYYGVGLSGRTALVIGRSRIAGIPISLLFMNQGATLINAGKSSPKDVLKRLCQQADIVVAAAGVPNLVRGDWVKPGAAIIDVGINYIRKDIATQCVGDVDFDDVRGIAGHITPVPGGIGPVCVMELLRNVLHNAIAASAITEPRPQPSTVRGLPSEAAP